MLYKLLRSLGKSPCEGLFEYVQIIPLLFGNLDSLMKIYLLSIDLIDFRSIHENLQFIFVQDGIELNILGFKCLLH